MDKWTKILGIVTLVLWLPLLVSVIMGWFTPVPIGCKVTYTVLIFALLIPPVCVWLHMHD